MMEKRDSLVRKPVVHRILLTAKGGNYGLMVTEGLNFPGEVIAMIQKETYCIARTKRVGMWWLGFRVGAGAFCG
jgi:hypothetical protein